VKTGPAPRRCLRGDQPKPETRAGDSRPGRGGDLVGGRVLPKKSGKKRRSRPRARGPEKEELKKGEACSGMNDRTVENARKE